MSYVNPDYRTKKLLREAIARGVKHSPYNPSRMFAELTNGDTTVEGPHFPAAHRWYARCKVVDGVIVEMYK